MRNSPSVGCFILRAQDTVWWWCAKTSRRSARRGEPTGRGARRLVEIEFDDNKITKEI